jgi:hypothetical protein
VTTTSRLGQDSLEKAVLGERPKQEPISIAPTASVSEEESLSEESPDHDTVQSWKKQEETSEEHLAQILSLRDHISNAETLNFWQRYFSDSQDDFISTEHFCDAIQ